MNLDESDFDELFAEVRVGRAEFDKLRRHWLTPGTKIVKLGIRRRPGVTYRVKNDGLWAKGGPLGGGEGLVARAPVLLSPNTHLYLDQDGDISAKPITVIDGWTAFGDIPPDLLERGRFTEPACVYVPIVTEVLEFSATWNAIVGVVGTRMEGTGQDRHRVKHIRENVTSGSVRRDKVDLARCMSTKIALAEHRIALGSMTTSRLMKAAERANDVEVERVGGANMREDDEAVRRAVLKAIETGHVSGDACRDLKAEFEVLSRSVTVKYVPVWIQHYEYKGGGFQLVVSAVDGTMGGTKPASSIVQRPPRQLWVLQHWLLVVGGLLALLALTIVMIIIAGLGSSG